MVRMSTHGKKSVVDLFLGLSTSGSPSNAHSLVIRARPDIASLYANHFGRKEIPTNSRRNQLI